MDLGVVHEDTAEERTWLRSPCIVLVQDMAEQYPEIPAGKEDYSVWYRSKRETFCLMGKFTFGQATRVSSETSP